jgi:putative solute:sodium symporter small subunit
MRRVRLSVRRRTAPVPTTDNPDCPRGGFLIHRRMAAPRPPDPIAQRSFEPPPVSSAMTLAHRRYWHFNVMLITVLMLIGFAVSFVVPFFARTLSSVRLAGFRLPFYLGAQGAIVIYLLLIAIYIAAMTRADRRLLQAAAADAAAADAATAPAAGPVKEAAR